MRSSLPVSQSKLEEIREETAKEEPLQSLREIIKHGWPETKASISSSARVYWDVGGELSELNGIIFKGERILVPTSLRTENPKYWKDFIKATYEPYKVQTESGEEKNRNRKMMTKLPDSGNLPAEKSYLHDPPSERVNRSSPCKGQVTQANPVVEESVPAFREDESDHSAEGYKETSEQCKTRSGRVIKRLLQLKDYV